MGGGAAVALLVLLASPSLAAAPPARAPPKAARQQWVRVLLVGDESTAGRNRSWDGTYRKALWGSLRRQDRLAVRFVGSQVDRQPARDTAAGEARLQERGHESASGHRHDGRPGYRMDQIRTVVQSSSWANGVEPPDAVVVIGGLVDLRRGGEPRQVGSCTPRHGENHLTAAAAAPALRLTHAPAGRRCSTRSGRPSEPCTGTGRSATCRCWWGS